MANESAPHHTRVEALHAALHAAWRGRVSDRSPRNSPNPFERIGSQQVLLPLLESLVEEMPVGLALLDWDLRYLFVNQGWRTRYQCDPNQLGQLHEACFPTMTAEWGEARDACLAGTPQHFVAQIPVGNPSQLQWLNWHLTPWYVQDELVGMIILAQDAIPGSPSSQPVGSYQLFQAFLNHAPQLAWVKGPDHRYRYGNVPLMRELGLRGTQFLGKTDADLFPAEVARQLWDIDQEVMQTNRPQHRMINLVFPRGDFRHALTYLFPFQLGNGERGVAGVAVDMTAQVQAESDLRQLNEELTSHVASRTAQVDKKEGEITQLAYTIAHDLRAPLRHMSAYIDIVLEEEGEQLTESGRTRLHKVHLAADKLGLMVDELLHYASTDRQDMTWETVNLNELIVDLRETLHPQDRHIRWEIQPLPLLKADRGMMRAVLLNLLDNAVKFTGPEPLACIEVGARRDLESVVIWVRDNGVGFNPAYQNKLFHLFQRLHTKQQFPGTGIGLANVQRIIQRHGGHIEAIGAEGEGATFFIHLPNDLLI